MRSDRRFPGFAVALLAVVLCANISVPPTPAYAVQSYVEGTDPAAPLFDPTDVVDIDLEMPDSSLALLTQEMCNGGDYQPGTLTVRTETATYGPLTVGIRLKGCWGSFRTLDAKAGWKIKVNYVSGQTLLGLKKLTLNNMVQDGSMIHEALGYRVFRAMGVAAPRVGYANVSFNGAEYGLYANIETLDKVALPRWYGAGQTTHLYEGSYWTDAITDHVANFEIDEGTDDRSDLHALANANALNGTAWWNAIRVRADMNQMTSMWATEMYIGHWDGYADHVWNNYYLHSTPAGKFTMLPWGLDQTFNDPLSFDSRADNGVMFRKCMSVPACKSLYATNLLRLRGTISQLKLSEMASAVSTAINPFMDVDPRKETDPMSARYYQDTAVGFVRGRITDLNDWISDNKPELVVPSSRVVGNRSTVSWPQAASHGLTVDHYQVAIRQSGKWRYVSTAALSLVVTQPAGSTIVYKVRPHTALGYGPWSVGTTSIRR
jgi:CotH kinase protein